MLQSIIYKILNLLASIFHSYFPRMEIFISPDIFLDRRQRGPIRLVLLVIIGWLVGNAVFSEMAQWIFLIFCMKLGNYKGRKVTEPDF